MLAKIKGNLLKDRELTMDFKLALNLLITPTFVQFISASYAVDNDEIPKSGWACKAITNLEKGNSVNCKNQEYNKKIRHVHPMGHDEYEGKLDVGGTCAGNFRKNFNKMELFEQRRLF